MIKSFADSRTAAIFVRRFVKSAPPDVAKRARRKLLQIDNAQGLEDLRIPPANHLEKLSGDRDGQYSIRVNRQWRICFRWNDGQAEEVEFTDYH